MLYVIATLRVRPEKRAICLEAARRVIAETRKADGCIYSRHAPEHDRSGPGRVCRALGIDRRARQSFRGTVYGGVARRGEECFMDRKVEIIAPEHVEARDVRMHAPRRCDNRKAQIDAAKVIDRVMLDADDRQRRRIVLTGENGTQVLLDLDKPVALRDGDGSLLDDGSIVQVNGQAERLLEITPSSPRDFVRLAWHLGNRHTDVQIVGKPHPYPL